MTWDSTAYNKYSSPTYLADNALIAQATRPLTKFEFTLLNQGHVGRVLISTMYELLHNYRPISWPENFIGERP